MRQQLSVLQPRCQQQSLKLSSQRRCCRHEARPNDLAVQLMRACGPPGCSICSKEDHGLWHTMPPATNNWCMAANSCLVTAHQHILTSLDHDCRDPGQTFNVDRETPWLLCDACCVGHDSAERTRQSKSSSVRTAGRGGAASSAAAVAAAASAPAGAAMAPPAPGTDPATEPNPAGACGARRTPLSEPRGLLAVPELESSSKGSSGSAPGGAPVNPPGWPRCASAAPKKAACAPVRW